MKLEFPKIFVLLFKDVRKTLNKELSLKIELIKQHETDKISKEGTVVNKMRAQFTIMLLGGIQSKFNESIEEDEEEQEDESSSKKQMDLGSESPYARSDTNQ